VIEWLSGGIVVFSAKAEDVLLKAFVEIVEDGVERSQFESDGEDEDKLRVRKGVFILLVVQPKRSWLGKSQLTNLGH